MDMEAALTTTEFGQQMLARKLIQRFAARQGFPGYANEATTNFFWDYLAIPKAEAPASFYDYIIKTLGEP